MNITEIESLSQGPASDHEVSAFELEGPIDVLNDDGDKIGEARLQVVLDWDGIELEHKVTCDPSIAKQVTRDYVDDCIMEARAELRSYIHQRWPEEW